MELRGPATGCIASRWIFRILTACGGEVAVGCASADNGDRADRRQSANRLAHASSMVVQNARRTDRTIRPAPADDWYAALAFEYQSMDSSP